jgi:tetratricopeptide (TPR) repeat protein
MSATPPLQLAAGVSIVPYRLERPLSPGTDVWLAQDEKQGRPVALKLLTRAVPSDRGRREALVMQLRKAAASLLHPGIVPVLDFIAREDALLSVMELVEGETLTARLRRGSPGQPEFMKIAWQLASALDQAHGREIFHGALTSDDVLLDRAGNVRLTGFGFNALSGRRERGEVLQLDIPAERVPSLAYLSPEQLSGKPVDRQSEVYSLGVLLYFLGTGQLPFDAASAAEMVAKGGGQSPRNPQELNPAMTRPMLHLIGKSIFKNRSSRYASMREVLEDIRKADPDIEKNAAFPVAPRAAAAAPAPRPAEKLQATFVIAELPYHDLLARKKPEAASMLGAKMQQIVGEAVYLFDGEILDSIGPRLVAIMPTSEKAIDAARRIVSDLAEHNASPGATGPVEPRTVIHRGEVIREDRTLAGPAAELAGRILASLEPLQLIVSERVLDDARIPAETAPLGRVDGVAFHPLPVDQTAVVPEAPPAAPSVEEEGPADEESRVPAGTASPRKKSWLPMVAAAGVAAVVLGATAFMFIRQREGAEQAVAVSTPASKPAAEAKPRPSKLFVPPFEVTTADAAVAEKAKTISAGVATLLRASGALPVTDAPSADALQLTVRSASADPVTQIIPQISGRPEGPAVAVADSGAAMSEIVRWISTTLQIPADRILSSVPSANEQFANAIMKRQQDPKGALVSVRAALAADPDFIAAQRLAIDLYDDAGDRGGALEAAMKVAAADNSDVDIRRRIGQWQAEKGSPTESVRWYGEVLRRKPDDLAALEALGRYALSAGDEAAFRKIVARVEKVAPAQGPRLHTPDLLALAGSYERAAPMYYDIEGQQARNGALAFKIGRIAALRDSFEIASIELGKLRESDPDYGAPLLEAYIAAKKDLLPETEKALQRAQQGAAWDEDVYTHSAEIYAMLSQRNKVIDSLEKAIARGEANATFVLRRPPFFYLGYDQRSSRIKSQLEAQKFELRAALSKITL